MEIKLHQLGKRYSSEWIFRKLDFHFQPGGKYAITGPNGSGKSTLLQVLAGAIEHNEGEINYAIKGNNLNPENIYRCVTLSAPYLELVEEMTLSEFIRFHRQTKGWLPGISAETIINSISLTSAATKEIRFFSSGMKQRVKLAQALLSGADLILLDEPLTNLDQEGVDTYYHLINQYASEKLVIVSSNDPREYRFCKETLDISAYK